MRAHDIAVFILDDTTVEFAAAIHHYAARRIEDGWRLDRLEIIPVALTEPLSRAL